MLHGHDLNINETNIQVEVQETDADEVAGNMHRKQKLWGIQRRNT